ncbi:MAG: hypothetical protein IK012_00815 [Fibrobacter sp.]|uniref:hypothetical protein n=1 Tax=Fibrobacter sp. TaxID=35828 RepID=UPI0025C57853|nr:hypothetical protein [Fibrobacter sp.]MBR4783785.1 hypothetical protein [Fibrobacter sp.]
MDAEFSSLHDVVLMANAAHKTAIDRCLIFNDNSFYRFCGANNTKICLRLTAVFGFIHLKKDILPPAGLLRYLLWYGPLVCPTCMPRSILFDEMLLKQFF